MIPYLSLFYILFNIGLINSQINKNSFPFENPARGIDIIETTDNGFLITGNEFSLKTRLASAILIKTDKNGNLIWQHEYSSELKSDFGWSLAEIDDGYLVLGFTENKKATKGLMIKTDFQGNLLWKKEIGDNSKQIAWSFLKDKNKLICVGEVNKSDSMNKAWVFATNLNGNIIWEKQIPSNKRSERLFYTDRLSKKHFVATGTSTLKDKTEDDILVLKFNRSGKVLWKKTIPIQGGRDVGHSVKVYNNQIYVYGYSEVEKDRFNPVIIQLDSKGQIVKKNEIKHDKDIRIMNGIKSENSHILIGYSKETNDKYFQLCIMYLNEQGDIEHLENFGNERLNTGYSIKNTISKEFVVTGAITKDKTGKSEVIFLKGANKN